MSNSSLARRLTLPALALVSVSTLAFGLVMMVHPTGSDALLMRADGLACAGLGLFGLLIVLVPFRRGERWAWLVLWFYPLFWAMHLFGGLPPGRDHVHQVLFLVVSAVGLLATSGSFFRAAPR